MSKNTGNLYQKTSFRNGGRVAGMGIVYDDYSETSYGPKYYDNPYVHLPNDHVKPEDLNGPVIVYFEKED